MIKYIEYKGEIRRRSEVMDENGVSRELLSWRLKRGWTLEDAISFPPGTEQPNNIIPNIDWENIEAFGEKKSFKEWAKDARCQVSVKKLRRQIKTGMSMEQAFSQEPKTSKAKIFQSTKEKIQHQKRTEWTAWGETKSVKKWAQDSRCVVSYTALRMRLLSGMSLKDAITILPHKTRRIKERMITAFGETKSIRAWAHDLRCHVSHEALRVRLLRGMRSEKAISMPATSISKKDVTSVSIYRTKKMLK